MSNEFITTLNFPYKFAFWSCLECQKEFIIIDVIKDMNKNLVKISPNFIWMNQHKKPYCPNCGSKNTYREE
jgi:rubrerythrin